MPQPRTIEIILNEYEMNRHFGAYIQRNGRTIAENEFLKALANLLLGLPSLQEKWVLNLDNIADPDTLRRNMIVKEIRQEIAELMGVEK